MGGSLSLSTSPHRRSLEALGLLHNSGDHVLVLIVMNIRMKMFARSKVTSTQVDLRRELSPRDLCQA